MLALISWHAHAYILVSILDPGTALGLLPGSLQLNPNSYAEFEATINTKTVAGLVFDYYGPDDFKFVALNVSTKQVIIGHFTASHGWVNDAVVSKSLLPETDYTLKITLQGTTVSVSLNGQAVLGHTFNAPVLDGFTGLLAKGATSFDNVTFKTNDEAFAPQPAALMAAADSTAALGSGEVLTSEALAPIVDEAIRRWTDSLGGNGDALAWLNQVDFEITDLSGTLLGQTIGNTVIIDVDAAGYGWFIDCTPADNREFSRRTLNGELFATPSSPAFGEMDLLTAVMHEIGHVLGFEHLSGTVMSPVLSTGERLTLNTLGLPGSQEGSVKDFAPQAGSKGTSQLLKLASGTKQVALIFDEWEGKLIRPDLSPPLGLALKFDPFAGDGLGTSEKDNGDDWIVVSKKFH